MATLLDDREPGIRPSVDADINLGGRCVHRTTSSQVMQSPLEVIGQPAWPSDWASSTAHQRYGAMVAATRTRDAIDLADDLGESTTINGNHTDPADEHPPLLRDGVQIHHESRRGRRDQVMLNIVDALALNHTLELEQHGVITFGLGPRRRLAPVPFVASEANTDYLVVPVT
jgi:hypothetical protein